MRILGIETSCDETAVAVLEGNDRTPHVRAEQVASQVDIHARFGGVVPEVASREHLRLLPPMVDDVMREADVGWPDLDAIAVTAGPGLMGALLVGVSFARAASAAAGLPVLPVHHLEGHLLAPGLSGELPAFPFVTLLVSGGHTMLIRVDGIGQYAVLGQTLDDAAGECFDKCARILDLPYPGGPAIAEMARQGDASRVILPRPMLRKDNLDFSFSGLKTAVLYAVRDAGGMDDQARADMAAGIEAAIAEVLAAKAVRACRREGVRHLVAAGGVAANARLRGRLRELARNQGISLCLPSPSYCTDNAAMIAHAAWLRLRDGCAALGEWDVDPRWPLE